jgi:hypothetical protein
MHCSLGYLVEELRRVLYRDSKRITKKTTAPTGSDGTYTHLPVLLETPKQMKNVALLSSSFQHQTVICAIATSGLNDSPD